MTFKEIIEANPDAGTRACELVYRKLTGKVPCSQWIEHSYGRAGGTVLRKSCNHSVDECYPSISIGSIHGEIGKPYKKLLTSLDAWGLLWEKMNFSQRYNYGKAMQDICGFTVSTTNFILVLRLELHHHLEAALRTLKTGCCGENGCDEVGEVWQPKDEIYPVDDSGTWVNCPTCEGTIKITLYDVWEREFDNER